MKAILYPYHMRSESSRLLADMFGTKRVFPDGKYKYRAGHTIICWGRSSLPQWHTPEVKYINHPLNVRKATNKYSTLKILTEAGVSCPEYTTQKEKAIEWIKQGSVVFCRKLLHANSGKGIVVASTEDELIDCPLYTKYIPKKYEFRVHVLGDGAVVSQKKKRNGWRELPEYSPKIRSHRNGWIFASPDFVDDRCVALAKTAVKTLGLDFGAVDVIFNEKKDTFYTLEINTAPGIEGKTVDYYYLYFKGLL